MSESTLFSPFCAQFCVEYFEGNEKKNETLTSTLRKTSILIYLFILKTNVLIRAIGEVGIGTLKVVSIVSK